MKKMNKELTIEEFGEIIDAFLKKNEINMLITLPEGTDKPQIRDNTGLGCTVQFYILLAAIQPVFKEMLETLEPGETQKESLIDGMLELVKDDLMNPKEDGRVKH